MAFDESKTVRVTGTVVSLTFINPVGALMVEQDGSRYLFATAAARDMITQQGFQKGTLKPGDRVEVSGVLSVGRQSLERATAARADLIVVDGKTVFNRATLKVVTTALPLDEAAADERKLKLAENQRKMEQLKMDLSVLRTHRADGDREVVNKETELVDLQNVVRALKAGMTAPEK